MFDFGSEDFNHSLSTPELRHPSCCMVLSSAGWEVRAVKPEAYWKEFPADIRWVAFGMQFIPWWTTSMV